MTEAEALTILREMLEDPTLEWTTDPYQLGKDLPYCLKTEAHVFRWEPEGSPDHFTLDGQRFDFTDNRELSAAVMDLTEPGSGGGGFFIPPAE